MDCASLYVTNVACELEDSKELKVVTIATVKATVTPNMEVPAPLRRGGANAGAPAQRSC
jgi:hypothetical protein